ncbi:DUF3237 family protein, partial [Streptomyces sp. LD120]|nr:DUF3237 family protein [Streptomyces physcomitrii]
PTAPFGPGDTTPQVIPSTGGHSHTGPGGQRPSCRTAKKITGADTRWATQRSGRTAELSAQAVFRTDSRAVGTGRPGTLTQSEGTGTSSMGTSLAQVLSGATIGSRTW